MNNITSDNNTKNLLISDLSYKYNLIINNIQRENKNRKN